MKTLILALALIAATAFATDWTIPDGKGGWKDNPACTSATCRETGIPDVVPALEPEPTVTDSDRDPATPAQSAPRYCEWDMLDGQLVMLVGPLANVQKAKADCKAFRPQAEVCSEDVRRKIEEAK